MMGGAPSPAGADIEDRPCQRDPTIEDPRPVVLLEVVRQARDASIHLGMGDGTTNDADGTPLCNVSRCFRFTKTPRIEEVISFFVI